VETKKLKIQFRKQLEEELQIFATMGSINDCSISKFKDLLP